MPVMRIVPRGSFLLGAGFDDPDRAAYEMPQKRIDIPASFAIGVFPVLASEYVHITGSPVPAPLPPEPERRWFDRFVASSPAARPAPPLPAVAGIPVTCVSFDDAQAFVDRLSAASEQKYRIPSEAEWEYACRAGSTTRYSCGDAIDSSRAVFGQSAGPFRWARSRPTASGFMTCTATCVSGPPTFGTTTSTSRRRTAAPPSTATVPCGWCAAAAGETPP